MIFRRLIITMVASTAVVGAGAVPASASGTPSTASPADETTVEVVPVVAPGVTRTASIVLGNYSPIPTTAQVQFGMDCVTAKNGVIEVKNKPLIVAVPGGDPDGAGVEPLVTVTDRVLFPASCIPAPPSPPATPPDGWIFADFGGVGEAPWAEKLTFISMGKPFTQNGASWKYNLTLKTGGVQPANSDVHHTLPQKFRSFFELRLINIDDPANLVWWCSKPGVSTNHQANAQAYNARWQQWISTHGSATAAQIYAYRDSIFGDYTYTCPGQPDVPGNVPGTP